MKVIVTGASGRMGKTVLAEIFSHPELSLHGITDRAGSTLLGEDAATLVGHSACGTRVTDALLPLASEAEGIIDFTLPAALKSHAQAATKAKIPLVVGTTGLSETDYTTLNLAANHIPIVYSGNMSLGVNLLSALVEKAAAALDLSFDIEVLEMHHKHKVDAPSGTALLLAAAAAKGRNIDLNEKAVFTREGVTGPRQQNDIGFAVMRGGSVVGEHEVVFAGEGERVMLRHIADDRVIFARGAIKALLWARHQKPGLYNLADVLGL